MVASDYNITRERMDEVALMSHTRAYEAHQAGRFKEEIVPVTAPVIDENGNATTKVIEQDDGLRPSTLEGLQKIKPAFPQWGNGVTTAGNASQVSGSNHLSLRSDSSHQVTDGAAAVMLMRRSKAEELGVPILAKHVSTSVVGVSPRVMGIGPVP